MANLKPASQLVLHCTVLVWNSNGKLADWRDSLGLDSGGKKNNKWFSSYRDDNSTLA